LRIKFVVCVVVSEFNLLSKTPIFNNTVCTSVNEVICHGIPDFRPIQDGDIVNVDVSVYYMGYHGDLNETFTVGAYIDVYICIYIYVYIFICIRICICMYR
jgi:methionine aminopeptidase